MSADENKPQKEKEIKTINVATQKTFRFKASARPEDIDRVVNDWLRLQAKSGAPAMLGKVYATGWLFGRYIYFQYLYSTKAAANG